MKSLLRNVRFYTLGVSIAWGVVVFIYTALTVHSEQLQIIRLTQWYALTSVTYLYITLFVGPLSRFRTNSFIQKWLKARRALGVSSFLFGLLHGSFAFFGQLGGFSGLFFLDNRYLLAISLSFTALVILAIMASTSFDWVVAKLRFKRWKMIHRLVYVAGILILIHAVMLGTHFQDLSSTIPVLLFSGLILLFLMHGILIDRLLSKKYALYQPQFGLTTIFITLVLTFIYFSYIAPENTGGGSGQNSFNVHAQHIQMAKDAVNGTVPGGMDVQNKTSTIPGLVGDRTKRYTVSFNPPENINPNQEVTLHFQVYDANSGNPVIFFQKIYEKVVHLIVVDSELQYFTHIHPDQSGVGFTITTTFPKDGQYHLYLDFQPLGAIEQQFAFSLNVGHVEKPVFSSQPPDTNLTKNFGNYQVTLTYPSPLKSNVLSIGQQQLKFTINDAKTGAPITTLKPYLAAYGHLVMINESTFDYLHVHPTNLTAPLPDQNGGPDVDFLPLGLYGPIKPGIYRVFGQFNPDNQLFVADFTVKVE